MQVFSDIKSYRKAMGKKAGKAAVTIGKFDGIHRGHQKLLSVVLEKREQTGGPAVIFGFDRPLASFFSTEIHRVLMTNPEKRRCLSAMGFDCMLEYPVSEETLRIEPEMFIRDVLVRGLGAEEIVVGPDCSFGYRGRGNVDMLRDLEKEYGYRTTVVEKVRLRDEIISSTSVRSRIRDGAMELACELLGRPYSLEGTVTHGKQLGSGVLNMPTVNLVPEEDKLLPPFGVYFSRVHTENGIYDGITNIGLRPTVSEGSGVTAETFLYEFSGDLYGRLIRTDLLHWHREEQKFSGIEELKKQMHNDMLSGTAYHRAHRGEEHQV